MSAILSINRASFGNIKKAPKRTRENISPHCSILHRKKCQARKTGEFFGAVNVGAEFRKAGLTLTVAAIFLGAFYLYQVNDLTNKGYEMKEVENKIISLKKDNEKNKIQEMELRSMYSIEKATRDLDLIGSKNISYLEIDGPVAMK